MTFKVGDRVRVRGTSGWAVTVYEVADVIAQPYPFQIFRPEPFGPWNRSGDFEPAPPEKPKYRIVRGPAPADTYTRCLAVQDELGYEWGWVPVERFGGNDKRVMDGLRSMMFALGYEEQQ